MTRINVVPVQELTQQHLLGEWKEICRVFTLVRKLKDRGINKYNFHKKIKQPDDYTLGTGHVYFYYNRLGYVLKRIDQLHTEMLSRGYSPNRISENELIEGIDSFYLNDYNPTPEALRVNRERIALRLSTKGE
jgi:deoxyribonuclease (pyrimidine dimer)